MNLIDTIPAEEMGLMVNYIKHYALDYNQQDYNEDDLRHVLRVWDEEKQHHLYTLFGQQLILRKPISFERSEEEARNELEDYLSNYTKPIPYFMEQMRKLRWEDSFQTDNEASYDDDYYYLTSYDTLVDKVWTGKTFSIYNSKKDKSIVIQEGMKLSRAYRKIANLYDLDGYEEFNLEYSRFLNQDHIIGELVISIHPMDYMTMSDNACDWQSCMNWPDTGEYCQGTVEMMNSNCVIVAYLEASHKFYPVSTLDTWSNKKWRQLFIANEFVITGVKPYPYSNCNITKAALDWIHELAVANCGYEYYAEPGIYNNKRCEVKDEFNDIHKYEIQFGTDMMYCDFNSRNGENYMYVSPHIPPECYYLNYSGASECVYCGCLNNIPQESKLLCYDCSDSKYCSCCGAEIDDGEYETLADGTVYCLECLYENCSRDFVEEEWYRDHELVDIYLVIKPKDSNKCEFIYNHPIYLTSNDFKKYTLALSNTLLKDRQLYYNALGDLDEHYYFFIDEAEDEEIVEQLERHLDFSLNTDSWFNENDEIDYDDILFSRATIKP